MHCLVTAGATVEPIDAVRRLTNASTGKLGCGLADALARAGHRVTLLLSESAQHIPRSKKIRIIRFTTTADLMEQMQSAAALKVKAIFHAAAVSDFRVKRPRKGKVSSAKTLSLELTPTPKIIVQLRKWHPDALLVGWKFEVDGNRNTTLKAARAQLATCQTNACVANGPAYGGGFGIVWEEVTHCADSRNLYRELLAMLR